MKPYRRWESPCGRHYINLFRTAYAYGYSANGCWGSLGAVTETEALAHVQTIVDVANSEGIRLIQVY